MRRKPAEFEDLVTPTGWVAEMFPGLRLRPDDLAEVEASAAADTAMTLRDFKARFNLLVQAAGALTAVAETHMTCLRHGIAAGRTDLLPAMERAEKVWGDAQAKIKAALGAERIGAKEDA